jgi:predicted PhzF superfamily epimerase YddE/YHI9
LGDNDDQRYEIQAADQRYRIQGRNCIQGEDMGRKSVLQVHASHKNDEWVIEVGGTCHLIAAGEWNI